MTRAMPVFHHGLQRALVNVGVALTLLTGGTAVAQEDAPLEDLGDPAEVEAASSTHR